MQAKELKAKLAFHIRDNVGVYVLYAIGVVVPAIVLVWQLAISYPCFY